MRVEIICARPRLRLDSVLRLVLFIGQLFDLGRHDLLRNNSIWLWPLLVELLPLSAGFGRRFLVAIINEQKVPRVVKIFGVLAILGAQREERILLLDILSLGEFAVAVAGLNLALKQLDVVALVEDAPFLLRLLELLILRNSGALLVQEHLNSRVCQVNQPMVKIFLQCVHILIQYLLERANQLVVPLEIGCDFQVELLRESLSLGKLENIQLLVVQHHPFQLLNLVQSIHYGVNIQVTFHAIIHVVDQLRPLTVPALRAKIFLKPVAEGDRQVHPLFLQLF